MNSSNHRSELVLNVLDGKCLASESDSQIEVINPANGLRSFLLSAGSPRDVDRAVTSGQTAFEDGRWKDASPSHRKKVLHALADRLGAEGERFDALDAEEMGKPISVTFCNAEAAAGVVRFCAEAVDKMAGDVYVSDKTSYVAQTWVPRGLVGAIVPWNFPTFNAALKVAPALAGGNSVVLKPSELSTRTAVRLGQLALDAGLPPGVLNVVPGVGEIVGKALGLHMGVDMVAFTGSGPIGKQFLMYSGQSNMKVVTAECGGKSPHIVFDDGLNIEAIAVSIADRILTNQGQICSVGSRVLVHRSIERELVDRVIARVRGVSMGDPLLPGTTFGPLASREQHSRVLDYVAAGKKEGVELVAGGRSTLTESGGYFVEPTVFRQVSTTSKMAQEEIFGPVLCVIPFDDEREAVRIANDTIYGLAAYVWTADLARALRLAKSIRSSVFINAAPPSGEGAGFAFSHEPFGQSGIGTESGLAGLQSYMRRHLMWISHP